VTELCCDATLGYRSRWTPFAIGDAMRLDEPYRLAHLPLVAPEHSDVIPALPGRDYDMGRHPPIWSLVLPIPWARLEASAPYRALDLALRESPLASKIAWEIAPRRQDKLHATVAGSLAKGEDVDPPIDAAARARLSAVGPFEVELRGLFGGDVNRGRLYLKTHPERRAGVNMLHLAQDALGRPRTDLYVVGLHNLRDHLDCDETQALSGMIKEWWDRPILRFTVDRLHLMSSRDDLVLDSRVEETILLRG
jgi:hypothetical protein